MNIEPGKEMDVKKSSVQLRKLVTCALFTALGVILGGALSMPAFPLGAYSLKIGVGVLPVILSGVLFGPLYGGMVGGLTDLLQALLFPKGAYVPWFTIVGIFFGLIPGLFFMRKKKVTFVRLLLAVFSGQFFSSVLLNTALLVYLYSMPWEIIYARIVNQSVMVPLYTIIIYGIIKLLGKNKIISQNFLV